MYRPLDYRSPLSTDRTIIYSLSRETGTGGDPGVPFDMASVLFTYRCGRYVSTVSVTVGWKQTVSIVSVSDFHQVTMHYFSLFL